MRQGMTVAGLVTVAGILAFGQSPDSKLEFEVATIKPWAAPAGGGRGMFMGLRGGPGTPDPGQITISGLPLKFLLANAYDVRPYQIIGPGWLDMERFDIVAKVPPGTTKEQARIMMQNLLADRFGMKLHHETKDSQVYELVVGKNGPKMQRSESQDDPAPPKEGAAPPAPGPPKLDKNGVPQLDRPGLIMMVRIGPKGPLSHMVGRQQTMPQFAQMLGNQVNRPVVDKTGLSGKYDFTLEFTFEPGAGPGGLALPPPPPGGFGGPGGGPGPVTAGGAGGGQASVGGGPPGGPKEGPVTAPLDSQTADSAPTIFTALQEQLGLKLDSKKAPLDMLVIDHIEKTPTEN
jgi:uncharacterized protein (TIGR03435 family)